MTPSSSHQLGQEEKAKLEAYKQKQLRSLETMQDDIYRKRYDELHPPYKARPLWQRLLLQGIIIVLIYLLLRIRWVF